MFEAVIFDWDGTLADSKPIIIKSFQQVLKELGCKVSNSFIERRIGVGPKNILIEALKECNLVFDEETINLLEKKKIKIHLDLSKKIELYNGVLDLLNSLKDKVKIALATMSNKEIIDKLLEVKNIRDYFDFVISFDEVKKPKPNPEIFIKSALKLNCHPEKCVVIEDSIFGLVAAKKANMKSIVVLSGTYSREELKKEKPDLIINAINEKKKILNFIFS
jgi:HAD superfamily hydrolase (TIGR01509 family)